MLNPIFEFFEVVAEELCTDPSRVITPNDFEIHDDFSPLLEDLKVTTHAKSTADAVQAAVKLLESHFKGKGSALPFIYDPYTALFQATNLPYLEFIKQMKSIRSIGKRSREFEVEVMNKLSSRVTGSLHRVGHPRDTKHSKSEFNAYLKVLGFERSVLLGADKDGGLDILWVLPLGTVPHQPIVSVQCKNGNFDLAEGDKSIGAGSRSLACHGRLQNTVHVPCVLFNDYLYPEILTTKPMNFVPLGLTDLSPLEVLTSTTAI
jgi:hypothetical protein